MIYYQRCTATLLLINILILCLAASVSAATDRVAAKTYKKTYIINDIHTLPKKRSTARYLQGGKDDEKQNNKDEDKEDKPPKDAPEPTLEPSLSPTTECSIYDKDKKCEKAEIGCFWNEEKEQCEQPDPTQAPTISPKPTETPTISPTLKPTNPQWLSQLCGGVNQTTCPPIPLPPPPTISPTISPSDRPSSSPSESPTDVPSSSPTVSSAPSAAPIPYARSPRVDVRYTNWFALTGEQQTLAQQLDYTQPTWDTIGSNPIEDLDWQRLSRAQKTVASQLGYDLNSWDCWQNHYQSYRWIDLDSEFTQSQQFWKMLGWDIYSWNRSSDEPASDSLNWYELSEEERDAAAALCYFRETWDEGNVQYGLDYPIYKPNFRYEHWFELEENKRAAANDMLKYNSLSWNVLGLNAIENSGWEELSEYERLGATSVGFTDLTWNCWQNHFRHYSWADIHFYGLDFPYTKLGWTEESWEGTDAAPPSQSKSWAELTSDQRKAAIELCYFRENWDGVDMTPNYSAFPYPKVKQRYVEWSLLPASIRRLVKGSLMYNKTTWNSLGTADIEETCWDKLTEEQRANAIDLGFYQRTWDCFQCHYRSYFWDEINEESKDALQVLGWSETSWNMNEIPPSYENEWDRLSENEQEIASKVCFFEDNWNKQNLEGVIFQEVTGVNEDGTDIIQEVIGVSEEGEAIYGQEIVGVTEDGELVYKEPGDTFGGTLGGGNIAFAPGAAPDSPPSSVDMIRINGIVVCIFASVAVIQLLFV